MKTSKTEMLKGFIIGVSMSVPGVSGGTMAIILGIYDKLLHSVSHFLEDVKGNFFFLVRFSLAAGLGIALLARVITWLSERFPLPVAFFFLGAIIGGIPALFRKTKEAPIRFSSVIYFFVGLAIVLSIALIPTGSFNIGQGSGAVHVLLLFVAGIIIAITLVMPGISTSHMLLVLGMYDSLLIAINKFDIVFLGILGITTLVGIILTTKPLEWVMKKFPHQTYCVIIGFVIGSTYEIFRNKVFSAVPTHATMNWWMLSILLSLVALGLGMLGIHYLTRFAND